MNKHQPQADNAADIEVANRIMNALIVKDVSLKELSEATGIKPHTIRRSLHQSRADRRSFSFREFHKIAEVLGVPPSALAPETLTAPADLLPQETAHAA